MGFRSDSGRILGVKLTHLIVPPSLEEEGRRLIKARNDAAGAGNVWLDTAELVVVPQLAG